MKVELLDVDEFVKLNKLKEVSSPILFQQGKVPDPDGLISNEIFGINTKDRKQTFAYIELYGHYFQPHVYKVVKFLFSGIDSIINGSEYYRVINGKLVKDESGETGISFIYKNWEKINWRNDSDSTIREERVSLLENTPKNIIFMTKQIVIPAFYRDIQSTSGGGETNELNRFYTNIIRYSNSLSQRGMFDFEMYAAESSIQNQIVAIYEYFKQKLEKKQGILRKYLMGKTVTYASRSVITANPYHDNDPDDAMIDYEHCGIPMSLLCGLVNPFLVPWVKRFFDNEFVSHNQHKEVFDPDTGETKSIERLESPETFFTEKYIRKMVDNFVRNPESRFDPIVVPISGGKTAKMVFTGKRMHGNDNPEQSTITYRPFTVTDLLFIALYDIVKDKHALITRYPMSHMFNVFPNKISVTSTIDTEPVILNGNIYKWYPAVDLSVPKHEIGTKFIDSLRFSNAYLPGLNGDYDGDQVTIKILYTQEANRELDHTMKRKSSFLNVSGSSAMRMIGNEAVQTFYVMTKDPSQKSKKVSTEDKKWLLSKGPKDFDFKTLVQMFGDVITPDPTMIETPKFDVTDILELSAAESPTKKAMTTTVGRYTFYMVCIVRAGMAEAIPYQNYCIDDGGYKKVESIISQALLDDKITTDNMIKWINYRDWLGLQLHAVVCTSFTPNIIKAPKEVKELKAKLIKQYKDGIEARDPKVSETIEKQLIAKTKEVLKDDPGMDIYMSGARGSLGNNFKNINIMRGAVRNPATGEYDIVLSALNDGMNKVDIPASSNVIVSGAYPKSCETAVTGYMSKEILAALQTEVLDDPGTDCGTKRTVGVTLTEKNVNNFLYRYVKGPNGKLVEITPDNKNEFIGKPLQLRSPLMCIGKRICNICSGNMYYKLGIRNAGLTTSAVATRLTDLNMKKFHNNTIKTHQLPLDELLI